MVPVAALETIVRKEAVRLQMGKRLAPIIASVLFISVLLQLDFMIARSHAASRSLSIFELWGQAAPAAPNHNAQAPQPSPRVEVRHYNLATIASMIRAHDQRLQMSEKERLFVWDRLLSIDQRLREMLWHSATLMEALGPLSERIGQLQGDLAFISVARRTVPPVTDAPRTRDFVRSMGAHKLEVPTVPQNWRADTHPKSGETLTNWVIRHQHESLGDHGMGGTLAGYHSSVVLYAIVDTRAQWEKDERATEIRRAWLGLLRSTQALDAEYALLMSALPQNDLRFLRMEHSPVSLEESSNRLHDVMADRP